eukprot:1135208-Rhodomonas_salina.4
MACGGGSAGHGWPLVAVGDVKVDPLSAYLLAMQSPCPMVAWCMRLAYLPVRLLCEARYWYSSRRVRYGTSRGGRGHAAQDTPPQPPKVNCSRSGHLKLTLDSP